VKRFWPLDWHGQLDAGTYELTWGAEAYGSMTEEFAILEKDGQLYFRGTPLVTGEPEESPSEEQDTLVDLSYPICSGAWKLRPIRLT
jgi:hypothetical protein